MPVLEERISHPRADGRLFGAGDERTLDDVIVSALYDASRGDGVACPVCGVPSFSHEGDDLVECGSCGSRLESA
jgi:DNA-directed RNA polymerase subunit RPC12/RpoP